MKRETGEDSEKKQTSVSRDEFRRQQDIERERFRKELQEKCRYAIVGADFKKIKKNIVDICTLFKYAAEGYKFEVIAALGICALIYLVLF
tara:strand:- start:1195 stop:1464 length:270 start_codon:yes stop_codon:yes gene_type:complete